MHTKRIWAWFYLITRIRKYKISYSGLCQHASSKPWSVVIFPFHWKGKKKLSPMILLTSLLKNIWAVFRNWLMFKICRYDLGQADLAIASFNELSVINLRRLFANKGSTFMDLQKQIIEKTPPKRKLTTDTIFWYNHIPSYPWNFSL